MNLYATQALPLNAEIARKMNTKPVPYNDIRPEDKRNKHMDAWAFREYANVTTLLMTAQYSFAKTMTKWPHWYTLERNWKRSPESFRNVARFLNEYGYHDPFHRHNQNKLNINGWVFFTYDTHWPHSELVNRAVFHNPSPYDAVADSYDQTYATPADLAENAMLSAKLREVFPGGVANILDIGCGSGLLLEVSPKIRPAQYLGIDPSWGMVRRFQEKHPDFAHRVAVCRFEECWFGRFDAIVSLFGSMNYVDSRYLERIPMMLTPAGVAFIMVMKPGIVPRVHATGEVVADFYQYDCPDGWEVHEWNHRYDILVYKPPFQ